MQPDRWRSQDKCKNHLIRCMNVCVCVCVVPLRQARCCLSPSWNIHSAMRYFIYIFFVVEKNNITINTILLLQAKIPISSKWLSVFKENSLHLKHANSARFPHGCIWLQQRISLLHSVSLFFLNFFAAAAISLCASSSCSAHFVWALVKIRVQISVQSSVRWK